MMMARNCDRRPCLLLLLSLTVKWNWDMFSFVILQSCLSLLGILDSGEGSASPSVVILSFLSLLS